MSSILLLLLKIFYYFSCILIIIIFTSSYYVNAGWIDPDTDPYEKTTISYYEDDNNDNYNNNNKVYDLVMSDEFDKTGRDFKDGHDPTWTALQRPDDARGEKGKSALEYYNDNMVYTHNGSLMIKTTNEDTKWKGFNPYKKGYEMLSKNYKSGMLQSWNKFCFTGGIVEISAKLPGKWDVQGLWPAFWLMGNLGRATFEGSTNLLWPWSYDKCRRDLQEAQTVSACNHINHFDLSPGKGRGSTEIDILEVMSGSEKKKKGHNVGLPYVGTTLQVAPGIEKKRPYAGYSPTIKDNWYRGMEYGNLTEMNIGFYGTLLDKTSEVEPAFRNKNQVYQADALSAISALNKTHWDDFHTFRLEWIPGKEGRLQWYLDGEFLYGIDGSVLEQTGAQIPVEPSYLIVNTAVSSTWGFPQECPDNCKCDCYDCKDATCACAIPEGFCATLPAYFEIDYIRVYQDKNDSRQNLGCDTEEFPSKKYIDGHKYKYKMPNAKEPLKDLVIGGGKCSNKKEKEIENEKENVNGKKKKEKKDHHQCGIQYGAGKCINEKCSCNEGWVGPTCLQPAYFEENMREVQSLTFSFFHINPTLKIFGTTLIVSLVGSVIFFKISINRLK